MVVFNPLALWNRLAPNAHEVYKRGFATVNASLYDYGILDNENRLIHFLAQCLHETQGMTKLRENLSYTAQRLTEVWPNRFPRLAVASLFEKNPEKLANEVYARRLGNIEPGDGWKYHGRGLLQITGRANYTRVAELVGVDLVDNPELVVTSEYCVQCAGAMWQILRCNEAADKDDVDLVTRLINGGYHGLLQRKAWTRKVREALDAPRSFNA